MAPSSLFLIVFASLFSFQLISAKQGSDFYPNPNVIRDSRGGYLWKSQNLEHVGLKSWMGKFKHELQNKTLQQVTLPGTHDSGAYYLTKELLPGYTSNLYEDLIELAEKLGLPINDIITPWALAQDRSFYEQLSAGIRYLDLRAGWNGSSWRTFHFELGVTVETLLQDIKKFLDEEQDEIVVVEVSHINTGKPKPTEKERELLAGMVNDILGDFLVPRQSDFDFTIGQMVSRGKRVLATITATELLSEYPNLWPGDAILNSYADSDKLDKMVSYNHKKVKEYNGGQFPGQLYKISWTLTPAADVIVESILPGRPHSLKDLADTANGSPFDTFVSSCQKAKQRMGNIVIIDHFETSKIVQLVSTNFS